MDARSFDNLEPQGYSHDNGIYTICSVKDVTTAVSYTRIQAPLPTAITLEKRLTFFQRLPYVPKIQKAYKIGDTEAVILLPDFDLLNMDILSYTKKLHIAEQLLLLMHHVHRQGYRLNYKTYTFVGIDKLQNQIVYFDFSATERVTCKEDCIPDTQHLGISLQQVFQETIPYSPKIALRMGGLVSTMMEGSFFCTESTLLIWQKLRQLVITTLNEHQPIDNHKSSSFPLAQAKKIVKRPSDIALAPAAAELPDINPTQQITPPAPRNQPPRRGTPRPQYPSHRLFPEIQDGGVIANSKYHTTPKLS